MFPLHRAGTKSLTICLSSRESRVSDLQDTGRDMMDSFSTWVGTKKAVKYRVTPCHAGT